MAIQSRVRLNSERCIGCGLCEENLPEVFAMGDFVAVVRTELVPDGLQEQLEVAARDCPVNAISILPVSRILAKSGRAPDDHHEKRQNEEENGEIGKNDRENGHLANLQNIEPDDAERFKSGKHNFTVVRNGADHDEHPRGVPRL